MSSHLKHEEECIDSKDSTDRGIHEYVLNFQDEAIPINASKSIVHHSKSLNGAIPRLLVLSALNTFNTDSDLIDKQYSTRKCSTLPKWINVDAPGAWRYKHITRGGNSTDSKKHKSAKKAWENQAHDFSLDEKVINFCVWSLVTESTQNDYE